MIEKAIRKLVIFSIDHPKTIIGLLLAITIIFAIQFPKIKIDTDPENMLEIGQPDRVFYSEVKKDFGIHDFIVLGITDEQGIFQPDTLTRIEQIISEILKIKGVITKDVISLTTTDNIKSKDDILDIKPAVHKIPQTKEESDNLQKDIANNPFLHEKIVSKDGKATAIYIPIQRKDMSYQIGKEIETILKNNLKPTQRYYLAGLPIAEDTFGYEMFKQMAMAAPLAGIGIMLILYLTLRKLSFIFIPMMDAMLSIIWAMGALIGLGFTVHIMSSMIPIFLMPIAILNDVHVLSEFVDRYPHIKDKRKTLLATMEELYIPSFYAPLTTAIGFASLALAHIPPVQVFGIFTAFGIILAWLFSMTAAPALIMLMKEEHIAKAFSYERKHLRQKKLLNVIGNFAWNKSNFIIIAFAALFLISGYGISKINVNDNPVRWFKYGHPLREADNLMNKLFGGTYMAYLVVEGNRNEIIKQPEVMSYIGRLQEFLEKDLSVDKLVGKTSSVADIVKRINFVLNNEDQRYDAVPQTSLAIGQMLFLFQSSGDPNDLDNFLDIDGKRANIWVQMKGGDNQQMAHVEDAVNKFIKDNPLPEGISLQWSGLTYINKVWQTIMVKGMLFAVTDSFILIFILIAFEIRSIMAGFLAMLPITLSILASYGILGLAGKDYDMPIAVCAALALGLGDDLAIHFFHRIKHYYNATGNINESIARYFQEPAMASFRMSIVIAVGFSPLLFSSLTPYITVGSFFALLMFFAAAVTLFLLPALTHLLGHRFLKRR
ncbi:MAG TPA: MMPL family transporter [Thermodesulfobacteriota bacterium]|nr:MMPL family transporter [Thermodesulfobacteriota bacterium]